MEVSDAPSIAGPGHNLASTEDIIKDRYESLFREVEAIAVEANAAKAELGEAVAVVNDAQRDALTAIGIKAKKLAKRVGETRLAQTGNRRSLPAQRSRYRRT